MSTEVVDTECCAPRGSCCSQCCCNMPHGKVVLFPTIMLTIASILSMIVLCNCRFVEAANSWGPHSDPYGYSYYDNFAGFWPGCVYYYSSSSNNESTRFQEDGARKAAMSFGLIACIVGVTAMIGLWPITCRPYSSMWINIIGGTAVFSFVSQLATLSMLGTQYCQEFGCRLGWAGIMSIIAAILWLISAIGVFMIPKSVESSPTNTRQAATVGETINITKTIQPDGTKVTEKVTTSPDGTKTIERTIEKNGAEQAVDGHSIAHAVVMNAEEP